MKNRKTAWTVRVIAGVLALAAIGTCCAVREHDAKDVPVIATPAPSTAGAEPTVAAPPPDQAALEARDAGAAPPPQDNAVARMMRRTDAADRTLLADIERQTQHAPPPEVNELLALRRAGKSRAELQRFIDAKLPAPLPRMYANRWLRAISGEAVPDAGATPVRLKAADEQVGPRRLQPIAPAPKP